MNPKEEQSELCAISADELILILAYRRCSERRKVAVRRFANTLAALALAIVPLRSVGNVIPLISIKK